MIIYNEIKLEVRLIDEIIGFGVFALEDIKEGTVIETCYGLNLTNMSTHPTVDYIYYTNNKHYLLFGYGSIYNHSDTPNSNWRVKSEKYNVFEIFAIKDIKKNEEISHNYGELYWKSRKKKII